MNHQKQQDFLARLLTDEKLRRNFLIEPQKTGSEHGLLENEAKELSDVLPEQLNFFAESLYWKRLREVEKFLPLTKANLDENFAAFFREFSQIYNPQSVKKHLEDAVEFCKFLLQKDIKGFEREIIRFEQAKLEFFGLGRKFVIRLIGHNLKTGQKLRFTSIRIWLKIGKKQIIF